MFIEKKDKCAKTYYSLKDVVKIYRLSIFFRYGFYVSLIIWVCGLTASQIIETSVGVKIVLIMIPLCVYIFFVIGKSVIEDKLRKEH